MNDAAQQLKHIVDVSRDIATQATTGTVIPFSIMDYSDTQDGFGLSNGTGLSLVHGDVTDAAPSSWSLQVSSAIAFDVPFSTNVRAWANEKNRTDVLGKYYYAVTPDHQMSAVVWETFAWSRMLADFNGPQGQAAIHWLIQLFTAAMDTASRGASEFIGQFGGRILRPDEDDLMALFGVSCG